MICIVALVVFSILAIFSASHRPMAAEAFDCVFRRVTFRPCHSGLDRRLKADITSFVLKRNKTAAKLLYKHFEIFSWLMVALTVWSLVASGIGGYNFLVHGNCNGPGDEGFCVLDPLGANSGHSAIETGEEGACSATASGFLGIDKFNRALFPRMTTGDNDVVFIGCYNCEYTRKVFPVMKELSLKGVTMTFAHLPRTDAMVFHSKVDVCVFDQYPERYIEYQDAMFGIPMEDIENQESVWNALSAFDVDALKECTDTEATQRQVDAQIASLETTGVYGTPTVFVNNESVVGPKPLRVYWFKLN